MKCSVSKKVSGQKFGPKLSKASAGPASFDLQDNGDVTFTVFAVDDAGNKSDASGVATLTDSSDNLSVITVDPPVGMTGALHTPTNPAPAVGTTANLTIVATWNDGSVGPFTFTTTVTIKSGGPTGVIPVFGPVTVH